MSAKNPNNSRPSSTKRPKSNNEKKKEKKDNKQETCRPSYLTDKGRGAGRAESECCAELKRRHEGRAQAQREQRTRREPQSPGPSAGRRRRKGGPVCAPICSTVRDGGGGAGAGGRGSAPTAGPPRAGPCVGGAPAGPCVGAAPAGGGDAKPEARSTQAQESADVMPVSREAPPPPPPPPEPEPEEPEPEPEPEPPPPPPPEKKPKERQRRCCWGCLTCCFRRDKKKRKKKKKKKPPPPPPPPEPEPKPEPEPEPEPEADAAGEPRSMSVNGGGSVGGGRGSVGSGGAAAAPWQRAGSQGGSLGPSWPPPPGAPGGSLGPDAQRPPYGAGWGPVPKAAMYCVGGPVSSAAPSFGGGAPAGSRAAGALPACVNPSLARRPCDGMPPSCKEESAMAGRAKCVKVKKPRKKSAKRRLCTSVCPPALPPSCKMRSCPYSQRLTYPIGELPYSASRRHVHCIPDQQAYKPNFSQKGGQCKENR